MLPNVGERNGKPKKSPKQNHRGVYEKANTWPSFRPTSWAKISWAKFWPESLVEKIGFQNEGDRMCTKKLGKHMSGQHSGQHILGKNPGQKTWSKEPLAKMKAKEWANKNWANIFQANTLGKISWTKFWPESLSEKILLQNEGGRMGKPKLGKHMSGQHSGQNTLGQILAIKLGQKNSPPK